MSDTVIIQLSRAHHALTLCKTAMEAKQIADIADAARVYLQRTQASVAAVNHATEIKLLAERQMGQFLKEMPKATGVMYSGRPDNKLADGSRILPEKVIPRLSDIGITNNESHEAQKLAAIPEERFIEKISKLTSNGGRLTKGAMFREPSESAKAVGVQAAEESKALWQLKTLWKRTGKKDRAKFIAWIPTQEDPASTS